MANSKDKNYVSVWWWMFALLITAIPCVGIVMIVVWALVGENESRKNYFRAIIAWFAIFWLFIGVVVLLGHWPDLKKQIQEWLHRVA